MVQTQDFCCQTLSGFPSELFYFELPSSYCIAHIKGETLHFQAEFTCLLFPNLFLDFCIPHPRALPIIYRSKSTPCYWAIVDLTASKTLKQKYEMVAKPRMAPPRAWSRITLSKRKVWQGKWATARLVSQSPIQYLHPFIACTFIMRYPIPPQLLPCAIHSWRFLLCSQPSAA